MKNSNDTIGNRTRDLPACSAVPQPTEPPGVFVYKRGYEILKYHEELATGSFVCEIYLVRIELESRS